MRQEKFTFQGQGGHALAARLDRPEGHARAYALFAHCFTCGKDIAAAARIARGLTARGYGVLRFDFTGLGHSEGEFGNTGFTSNMQDLIAAARHLRETGMAPSILIGHSLGGAAVLAAATEIESVRAVVSIGAPADPGHVLHNFGSDVARIRAEGEATVQLAGRSFRISKSFVEDVEGATLKDRLARLKAALLVMHAPLDATVGVENAAEIFTAARHPKSFVSLDDADHLLTKPKDAEYAADVIAAWADRYAAAEDAARQAAAPAAPPPAAPDGPPAPEGVTRVVDASDGKFLQHVSVGAHRLVADEPASLGGTDRGPTPYQLVSAGLGACTSMTIRMYARRKGWTLNHVSVDVSHEKTHATDCEGCETAERRIDVFRRVIRLEGELDAAQRTRLMEIADRCPVHRTLEASARIETVEA
ncbi:MAG: bifunctional alpha/beta hydrolase/OsmC family protein [Pseudomonadota bacterium]